RRSNLSPRLPSSPSPLRGRAWGGALAIRSPTADTVPPAPRLALTFSVVGENLGATNPTGGATPFSTSPGMHVPKLDVRATGAGGSCAHSRGRQYFWLNL